MGIRFGLLDYYGGLHCDDKLEVKIDDEWIPTRIELCSFGYLKASGIGSSFAKLL